MKFDANDHKAFCVEGGTVKLVGTECESIVKEVENLLDDDVMYRAMCQTSNPYGDGKASQRILDILLKHHARSDGHMRGGFISSDS